MKRLALAMMLILPLACGGEEAADRVRDAGTQAAESVRNAGTAVKDRVSAAVPLGRIASAEEIERERFNEEWRRVQSMQAARASQRAATSSASGAAAQVKFAQTAQFTEKIEQINSNIDQLPVQVPIKGDVSGPSVLKTQILLDRAKFSPGIIDGRWGKNTEIALHWFQRENGVEPTGSVDQNSYRALASKGGNQPFITQYQVTSQDVAGPFVKISDDVYENAKLDCMCYENAGEMLAEKFHVSPALLERLNPGVTLASIQAGQTLNVPNLQRAPVEVQLSGNEVTLPNVNKNQSNRITRVVISLGGNYYHGFDSGGNLIFHAPTTVGSDYDPSPTETLKQTGTAFAPWFHYQPKLFADVPDTEEEAQIAPGPNSPVGLVWMQLSKENYGMHGTSAPETIGYASSHGCIRLTNWDALHVAQNLQQGAKVEFVDPRGGEGAASAE